GVDHDEDHADERDEQNVDGGANQALDVGPNLLKLAQGFAASLIFERRIGQLKRMPHAVGIDPGAEALRDDVGEVVLKVFGDAGDERNTHSRRQQKAHATDEL